MIKKVEDLMDLTLREILEKYVVLHNLECGYYYGFAEAETVEKLFKNYNIEEDYPEAFNVESVIQDEVLTDYGEEIIDYQKMEKIMQNLGITKKGGCKNWK